MSDSIEKDLKALLQLRRARLQRSEMALARARQAERRSAEEVVERDQRARQTEEDGKREEAELALNLFQRQTVLSQITAFRNQVSRLRQGAKQARDEVEQARNRLLEAKGQTREAVEKQRTAYRAVEKLEFSLSELAGEFRGNAWSE